MSGIIFELDRAIELFRRGRKHLGIAHASQPLGPTAHLSAGNNGAIVAIAKAGLEWNPSCDTSFTVYHSAAALRAATKNLTAEITESAEKKHKNLCG